MKYGKMTLGQIEAITNKLGGQDVVDDILSGKLIVTLTAAPTPLLSHLGTITVPHQCSFLADDCLQIGNCGIGWIGSNFKERFLGGNTKECISEVTLRYSRLEKSSLDGPIIKELGGYAETNLSDISYLFTLQSKGEAGALLVDGHANIFYVRDRNGELCAVSASWSGSCWSVGADAVAGPDEWFGGSRVFSRNS